ncbi:CHY zinc finger protein [soil metagenome]
MKVHSVEIIGTDVDAQTRCAHYNSEIDIIAIKFKCCGKWFPCFKCHAGHTNHSAEVWSVEESDTLAILCGICGYQLAISEYFKCASVCPKCFSNFNPGCANHYHLYFEDGGTRTLVRLNQKSYQ